jgi:hypothetical protein
VILYEGFAELDPETLKVLSQYGQPDIVTDDYIVECKKGTFGELGGNKAMDQAQGYVQLIQHLKDKGVEKTLVYWFDQRPTGSGWEKIIDYLKANGVELMPEELFGDG